MPPYRRIELLKSGGIETPAFVFDMSVLRQDIEHAKSMICDSDTRLLFALKSYSIVRGLEYIAQEVDGFAASSLFEALLARDISDENHSLHLTAPGLRADEIEQICTLVQYLSFNSLQQWHRHKALIPKHVSVGLRINPQLSFVEDARYDPCRKHSKLGIPFDDMLSLVRQSPDQFDHVAGLHIHNNCDSRDLSPMLATSERLLPLIDALQGRIKWINLGGGYLFHDPLHGEVLQQVKAMLKNHGCPRIFIEPGAALVRRAGCFVSSVVDLFTRDDRHIAVLDTSVNHMPEVFEYQFEPDILGADNEGDYEYLLAGSACLAGDLFGLYSFTDPLRIGSRIIFPDMGAYSMVKANMFNGINLPNIYALEESGKIVEIKRYSYRDYRCLCGGQDVTYS